ncbi:signal recognition particle protein [Alphaproteobacteria bacterium HT1-32]|nr:signal recognition particle protein [Alphaproteobacteria bacterium HT1-32]|tara:strand:+ start:67503 stop:68867 length:1365 start_codon:yes stop_codon:yes gene_type:complete
MFDALQTRLGDVFEKLKRRGALSESDVSEALREIRVALLDADVALPVVKELIDKVREESVGEKVLKSVTPGQQVVKIVHDTLTDMLGRQVEDLDLTVSPPMGIMVVGLQGSGKTTSCAKIAKRLTEKDRKRVLMASLDVYRPAAQQQLQTLGDSILVQTLNIVPGEPPVAIAKRARQTALLEGFDVYILDTAGRLSIDDALMTEVEQVRDATKPAETLLVADAMTGQDAVNVADTFNQRVGLTGIMLTRVDGDARGGAALSMRAVTGRPIKLLGVGEKLEDLEPFHPERIAGRILGMGDVVSLVEKATEQFEADEAEALAKKLQKGKFDLDDMAAQLKQITNMGDMEGLLGMLPGVGKMKKQLANANIDSKAIGRQTAIISSMTKSERANPKLINGSRRKRIAAGSGVDVQDVNRLLKQHRQMADMVRKMGKMGKKGMMRGLAGMMPPGFGGPR